MAAFSDGESTNMNLRQPAEWEHHDACWLAWPSHADLWQEDLELARAEFVALCCAIADLDPRSNKPRGERLEILVPDKRQRELASAALNKVGASFHEIPFGDIWLRDTAPIFVQKDGAATAIPVSFLFNGWGTKYVLPFDDKVSSAIQSHFKGGILKNWILEGGSIEADGEGTCLTTRQCLLNPNRNPNLTKNDIEKHLFEGLGISKTLWLNQGLLNDHTDGHIDTIARFVAPGVAMCMKAMLSDDPNREVFEEIVHDLRSFTDAKGRKLEVIQIPSPGKITPKEQDEQEEEGEEGSESGEQAEEFIMPASYLNFYVSNTSVIVPTYGSEMDSEAVAAISRCFPGRKTVGLSAKAILSGGGAFHCITQQQPSIARVVST